MTYGAIALSPEEAAHYARVQTRTMQRWVFGDAASDAVIGSQLAKSGESEKLVTFLDFVQVLAIRQVRLKEKKFPLPRIRKACERATNDHGIEYPLAAKDHCIFLFGPKDKPLLCEMVIHFGQDDLGKDRYLQLTGRKAGNLVLSEIAEPFMRRIRFGESKWAEEYTAFETDAGRIVMDPHKRFGEPFFAFMRIHGAGALGGISGRGKRRECRVRVWRWFG
jgi:hypothetical protein